MAESAISELRARVSGSIKRLAGEVLGDERLEREGRLRVEQGHASSSARAHDALAAEAHDRADADLARAASTRAAGEQRAAEQGEQREHAIEARRDTR
ncbi:MAG TPA: hypothetical protein VHX88_11385, partial [Solirubrobacteraceae bacterium]|nr:hypothetical protein [Solirubrobacteraceae bacterium]